MGKAFHHEAGKRGRFQHVADHGDKIDFRLGIGLAVVPIAGVLCDRDFGDSGVKQPPAGSLDDDGNGFKACAPLTYTRHLGRQARNVYGGSPRVPGSRQIVEEWRSIMASRAEDSAMAASRDITSGSCIGFLDCASGENSLLLDENSARLVAACSSAHTREAM